MVDDIHRLGIKLKFVYSVCGLFLGFTSIIVGGVLTLYGAFGKTSFVAKMIGFETSLTDAPPGVVLFVVGLFMVRFTKFAVIEQHKTTEELRQETPAPPIIVPSPLPAAAPPVFIPPASPPSSPAPTKPGRTGKSAENLTMRGGDILTRTTEHRIAYKRHPAKPPKAAAATPAAAKPAAAKAPAKPVAKAAAKPAAKAAAKSVSKAAAKPAAAKAPAKPVANAAAKPVAKAAAKSVSKAAAKPAAKALKRAAKR